MPTEDSVVLSDSVLAETGKQRLIDRCVSAGAPVAPPNDSPVTTDASDAPAAPAVPAAPADTDTSDALAAPAAPDAPAKPLTDPVPTADFFRRIMC